MLGITTVTALLRCRRVHAVLQAYLDGAVDCATEAMVERHVEACRACGHELWVYREIATVLGERRIADPGAVQRLEMLAQQLSAHGADEPGEGEAR